MPAVLPPGPNFLLRRVPQLVTPPALVYALSSVARTYFHYTPPTWLLALAYVLCWPIALIVHVQWTDIANARRAKALGAVIPPGIKHNYPGSLDLILELFRVAKSGYLVENIFNATEKYGPTFNFRVMFEDRIVTTEPEYIKMMLATNFTYYEKGPKFFEQFVDFLGLGVFNSDGEMWKFHRTMTRPFFSKDRISHFELFDKRAEIALSRMATRFKDDIPVDWQDLVARFTMDSATEFLFGKNVQSLDAPLPYPSTYAAVHSPVSAVSTHPADRFVSAFQEGQEATAVRARFLQAWPLFEFFGNNVRRHMAGVHEFVDPLVKAALKRKAERQSAGEDVEKEGEKEVQEGDTLLDHLVRCTDDHKVIEDETLNILLAGRDTTACTLTFAVYAMAEHPEMMDRLRKEILDIVGPTRRPTYDDVREMKYMRAFINEVLRLFPAVPVNSRTPPNAMAWKSLTPDGPDFFVPAGARCVYSSLVMHRRKDLWGPDALSFDPDRFLDERVQKYLVPNPFIFLPFNAGPRICLGQQFAYNEISFMLVRLLQRFSAIRLRQDAHPEAIPPPGVQQSPYAVDGFEKVWMRSHLTAYAKNGLWVEMDEVVQE